MPSLHVLSDTSRAIPPVFLTKIHYTSFPAASEVSSILESRITGTAVGGNVEETGRVLSTLRFSGILRTYNFSIEVSGMVLDASGD